MQVWKPIEQAPMNTGVLVAKRNQPNEYFMDFVVIDEFGYCYDIENKLYLIYIPTHFLEIETPNF